MGVFWVYHVINLSVPSPIPFKSQVHLYLGGLLSKGQVVRKKPFFGEEMDQVQADTHGVGLKTSLI